MGLIPGLGRSSGVGNSNLFCILAWKIARTEEPGGLHVITESDMTERLSTHAHSNLPKALLVSRDGCHSRYEKSLARSLEDREGDVGWGKGQTQNGCGGSRARSAYLQPCLVLGTSGALQPGVR